MQIQDQPYSKQVKIRQDIDDFLEELECSRPHFCGNRYIQARTFQNGRNSKKGKNGKSGFRRLLSRDRESKRLTYRNKQKYKFSKMSENKENNNLNRPSQVEALEASLKGSPDSTLTSKVGGNCSPDPRELRASEAFNARNRPQNYVQQSNLSVPRRCPAPKSRRNFNSSTNRSGLLRPQRSLSRRQIHNSTHQRPRQAPQKRPYPQKKVNFAQNRSLSKRVFSRRNLNQSSQRKPLKPSNNIKDTPSSSEELEITNSSCLNQGLSRPSKSISTANVTLSIEVQTINRPRVAQNQPKKAQIQPNPVETENAKIDRIGARKADKCNKRPYGGIRRNRGGKNPKNPKKKRLIRRGPDSKNVANEQDLEAPKSSRIALRANISGMNSSVERNEVSGVVSGSKDLSGFEDNSESLRTSFKVLKGIEEEKTVRFSISSRENEEKSKKRGQKEPEIGNETEDSEEEEEHSSTSDGSSQSQDTQKSSETEDLVENPQNPSESQSQSPLKPAMRRRNDENSCFQNLQFKRLPREMSRKSNTSLKSRKSRQSGICDFSQNSLHYHQPKRIRRQKGVRRITRKRSQRSLRLSESRMLSGAKKGRKMEFEKMGHMRGFRDLLKEESYDDYVELKRRKPFKKILA